MNVFDVHVFVQMKFPYVSLQNTNWFLSPRENTINQTEPTIHSPSPVRPVFQCSYCIE